MIGIPISFVLAVVANLGDWSLGWIYLALGALLGSMMFYTHYEPRDRSRHRR
ncbi:MAG TPA: hypothetical protein VK631_21050 [Solirubrobacteraceae bacterium]|nr:hypothetical protein [Solirubrobacteraceae bacterium]